MSNRKEALASFHRTTILESANALFLEKGVEGSTMDEIAKQADYSKSTLYVYFKSKEDIFNYIIRDAMLRFEEDMTHLSQTQAGVSDFFLGVCANLVKMYDKHPMYFDGLTGRIDVSDDALVSDPILLEIYDAGERLNDIMLAKLRQGEDEKLLRPGQADMDTLFVLWASICGIIVTTSEKRHYVSYRMAASRESIMNHGFQLLLRSILLEKE